MSWFVCVCLHAMSGCIMSSVCGSDKFTARVYCEGLGACVKGPVTRKGLDVSRRADRCSAEGEREAVFVYASCVCVCVTLRSCLNPLSLSNNEEGGGRCQCASPSASLCLSSPADSPLISCPPTYFIYSPVFSHEACFTSLGDVTHTVWSQTSVHWQISLEY